MVNKVDIVSNMLERDLEEGLLKVFLALDGRTLAACSLVCKGWSLFLRQRVWRNQVVRPALVASLREQWKQNKPSVVTKTVDCSKGNSYIVCDEELTLVGLKNDNVRVFGNINPRAGGERIRSERGEEEVFPTVATLDCQFWLGPGVIVTAGGGLVQCWNRQTFELEYRRAHHAQREDAKVFGVTVLRSGMIAAGAGGLGPRCKSLCGTWSRAAEWKGLR